MFTHRVGLLISSYPAPQVRNSRRREDELCRILQHWSTAHFRIHLWGCKYALRLQDVILEYILDALGIRRDILSSLPTLEKSLWKAQDQFCESQISSAYPFNGCKRGHAHSVWWIDIHIVLMATCFRCLKADIIAHNQLRMSYIGLRWLQGLSIKWYVCVVGNWAIASTTPTKIYSLAMEATKVGQSNHLVELIGNKCHPVGKDNLRVFIDDRICSWTANKIPLTKQTEIAEKW